METARPTAEELTAWLLAWMQTELRIESDQFTSDRPFTSYGMDSIHSMMLVGDLEEHLQRRLSPTLAWDYPTPALLAEHLSDLPASRTEELDEVAAGELLTRIEDLPEDVIDRLLRSRLGDG